VTRAKGGLTQVAPFTASNYPSTVIDRAPTVTVKVTVVSGSPPDGVLGEEYASVVGLSTPADAAPGDSAIPMTAAAVRMRNTDVNTGPLI
jgi:hypothetical protein